MNRISHLLLISFIVLIYISGVFLCYSGNNNQNFINKTVSRCDNDRDSAYTPYIQEGKVWEYYMIDTCGHKVHANLFRYVFQGIEEHFERTYHRLVLFEIEYYSGTINHIVTHSTSSVDFVIALLREDDRKVYQLVSVDEMKYYNGNIPVCLPDNYNYHGNVLLKDSIYMGFENRETYPGQEILIYDFNPNVGDINSSQFFFYPINEELARKLISPAIVSSKRNHEPIDGLSANSLTIINQEVEMDKYLVNLWNYDLFSTTEDFSALMETFHQKYTTEIIEGIGNVGYGSILSPGALPYDNPSHTYNRWYGFNNLYDGNRNVVYKGFDITSTFPSAIQETFLDSDNTEVLYDLHGRRIKSSKSGVPYICPKKRKIMW